jgi:WD40 repeat protein
MSVRVAPDGSALLLWEMAPEGDTIWNLDLRRGGTRRELGGERYTWFAWGPEADQITGGRYIETGSEIVTARTGADSSGTAVLPFSRSNIFVSEWSNDGQVLVGAGEGAIWLCRRGEGCRPVPKREDVFEFAPALSPDGRWLAFASNESSRHEVYLRSTTEPESIQQVSFRGGTTPVWSRDGSELFFCSTDGTLTFYAVATETRSRGGLRIGEPELLFKLQGRLMFTNPIRSWDVAPDGRFVFIIPSDQDLESALYEESCPDRIHIVQSWTSRLNR